MNVLAVEQTHQTSACTAEQQITPCDETDWGCNGGDPPRAWEHMQNTASDTAKDSDNPSAQRSSRIRATAAFMTIDADGAAVKQIMINEVCDCGKDHSRVHATRKRDSVLEENSYRTSAEHFEMDPSPWPEAWGTNANGMIAKSGPESFCVNVAPQDSKPGMNGTGTCETRSLDSDEDDEANAVELERRHSKFHGAWQRTSMDMEKSHGPNCQIKAQLFELVHAGKTRRAVSDIGVRRESGHTIGSPIC